jgi:exodeoxyribonuclease V gamma subunit
MSGSSCTSWAERRRCSRPWATRGTSGSGVPPFADAPLPEPDERLHILDLDDLTRVLVNPAAYFLTQGVGIRLPEEAEVPQDVEPFDLAGLERYQVRQALLQRFGEGRDLSVAIGWLRAAGSLPHGVPGELI